MLCGAAWQDQYIAEASVVAPMMQIDAEFTKRTLRAPCGSRVRRSLICIFLIDVELAQGDGKNITGNITEVGRSRSANPFALADTRVTLHSGHMGNTSGILGKPKCHGRSVTKWMKDFDL
jgi:hypothetical protein